MSFFYSSKNLNEIKKYYQYVKFVRNDNKTIFWHIHKLLSLTRDSKHLLTALQGLINCIYQFFAVY